MNISLNWLKEYLPLDLSPAEIAETLTNIGLAVDGIEEYESIPGGLKGVVVGKVVECIKHPNADKLSLTKVDIGTGTLLQIVCGAPNVAAGQTVLVATIGSILHTSKGEKLEIKKGKIRGEVSEGMICAGDELSINDDHSGIIVLEDKWEAGTAASVIYPVYTDTIFEVDLTPNRSDATCHVGVAKDLAAYLTVHKGEKYKFKHSIDEDVFIDQKDKTIRVRIEDTLACPRYSGISITGVTISPSPLWLQHRLKAIGVKSINNVVDITNYVLHAYGQPLHAFDYDKIGSHTIRVKKLPAGTKFLCLDNIERSLHQDDLMICNGDSVPMCIGGVFGGLHSGISENTESIFLESAHFNASSIRRTSMRHVLRTDAATRFEKGTDPANTVKALKIAASMIVQLAGGRLASEIVDEYADPIVPVELSVSFDQVRAVIGQKISNDHIVDVLNALEMNPQPMNESHVKVKVPTNKADVKREIDVIEEILRIHGYNTVPMPSKMEVSFGVSSESSKKQAAKEDIAHHLTHLGFSEMMGLSLVDSRTVKLTGYEGNDLVHINNTSNVHLDIMRPDLIRSGLQSLQFNQNRQQLDLKLFEFGKTYRSSEEAWPFNEHEYLGVYITGAITPEHWQSKDTKQGIFYLKGLVDNFFSGWSLNKIAESTLDHADFEYGFQLSSKQDVLVRYGKLNSKLARDFDLRGEVFVALFDWEKIWSWIKTKQVTAISLPSKFPSVRRDLATVVEKSVKWSDITAILSSSKIPNLISYNLFDVFEHEERVGKDKKSLAIGFVFENDQQTLKDSDLDKSMKLIQEKLKEKAGAVIR